MLIVEGVEMTKVGRSNMLAISEGIKRESLFGEISKAVSQWPEHEREIFAQAHYQGQSSEEISRSLKINPEEVSAILRLCERKLHNSLRDFRKSGSEKPSNGAHETVCPSCCPKATKAIQAPGPRIDRIPDVFRKSA
jgi:hypothetical protein